MMYQREEGRMIIAMAKRIPIFFLVLVLVGWCLIPLAHAAGDGEINWVDGYISAIGSGAAAVKGNMAQLRPMAKRAAVADAYRSLLETIKGVKIDSSTTVENFMVSQDIIRTQVEGVVKNTKLFKETFEPQPDGSLLATVEIRLCITACSGQRSLVEALNIDQRNEAPSIPQKQLQEVPVVDVPKPPKEYKIIYDSSQPVTGIVFSLEGRIFDRVLLPVIVAEELGDSLVTVYSAKRVSPSVIRTYGTVRYADSVEQARSNQRLGNNAMIIPASRITKENMIVIKGEAARLIKETTSHGNDYLSEAKIVISAQ
jgi:hypothetical protein